MTKKLNVLNLGEFKEFKEIRRTEEQYERYLGTLANSQLEIEVNSLLDEYSGDSYGNDFFSKGKLILKEIKARAHYSVKHKIERMTDSTLKLL